MYTRKKTSPLSSDIFVDRRVTKSTVHKRLCRRKKGFHANSIDSRPWWLKVDYVAQSQRE
jgi:hypothetical protein